MTARALKTCIIGRHSKQKMELYICGLAGDHYRPGEVRTRITTRVNMTAAMASAARDSHSSQFSIFIPISCISRMSSGCRENSSHMPVLVVVWNAAYTTMMAKEVENEKSAI